MAGFKYHVFLSHSSSDKPAVEELAIRLRREGIEPWLDKWNLVPGQAWQPAIEQALEDCATCAVAIGSSGFGAWQNEEMRIAIDRRVAAGQGRFRVIPVLLPGVDRPERGKLPPFLLATTWVEFRRSLDDADAFHRLICGIQGKEPGAAPGGAAFEGACPYRGLEVFDVEHAPFFFGREALSEWLVNKVRPKVTGQENRFLAIVGASGSGKSSLARAGMLAALKSGALDRSAAWPLVVFKPGRDPVESLSVALAALPGGASLIKDTRDLLNIEAFGDDPKSLHTLARLALRDAPRSCRLFVLVDQAEEVFTLCEDAAARRAFFDALLYAATVADGQTIVVLTMRADLYGKCASHPALAAAMSDHHLLVGPMTEDEITRAIERPALLAGGEFESGLVGMLLQDVEGQAGALPLLQFALMELWRRREGRRLTVSDYKAIGGLQGALKNRADDALGQFDDARRDLCRRIFLRLTQPGEGSEDTKRRSSFDELVPAGADPRVVEAVVRRLADTRLITIEGSSNASGEASVEVAHEALIRGWGQLREWIEADRAGLRLQRQITEAAREWTAHGRESSFLYHGTRLDVARGWARTHRDELSALESQFLTASRFNRLKGKLALVVSSLLIIGLAGGGWTLFQSRERGRSLRMTQRVEEDLKKAGALDDTSRWPEAIELIEEAQKSLSEPGVGDESLRRRVAESLDEYKKKEKNREAADRDRRFVAALDLARLLGDAEKDGLFISKATILKYQETFREFGLDIEALSTEKAVELIRAKPAEIRVALAATLDDWARVSGPPIHSRLRTIAREVDPDSWRNQIRDAEEENDPKEALLQLTSVPEIDQQPATTLLRLGTALLNVDALDVGETLLRRAQHLHPDDFWINQTLAMALAGAVPPRNDELIRYLSIAVALSPASSVAKSNLGIALSQGGRLDEAKDYFDEAIGLDSGSGLAYCARGNIYFAKQEYDNAFVDFDKAIGLQTGAVLAYNGRGAAYLAKQKFDKAITDFDQAIRLDPNFAPAYYYRGNAYQAKQDFEKAVANFDKAVELAPNFALAYNARAWLRATCPDEKYRIGKLAVESANRACELTAGNNASFLDTLAAACAEAGDFEAAIKWQQKAIGLLATKDPLRQDIESRLSLYQAKKPFHEKSKSGRADDGSAQPSRP